ncbi:putative calcium-binding protein [Fasciolopsis buskii]|uniref:Putative calcium-binding protein n=1 Tax=Fasciolopsis buskii TaxID=27845 RepID=A0A8E0RQE2_9TREM|nr:putative calcium-binding protein [Fasciolopsis buski]
MFYLIDRDKSGVIDCEELGQYLRTSDFDDYFISRFLKAFDADRDGKITFEEYRRSLHKVPHVQKTYTTWHQILHKVDKDKNGYITTDELYDVLRESGDSGTVNVKQLQSFIREYDRDGDGKLNYHEFLDYILDTPVNQATNSSKNSGNKSPTR